MTRPGSIAAAIAPPGSTLSSRRFSYGPGRRWKYHQGTPLIIETTIVSGPSRPRSAGRTSRSWCALTVSSTASCAPASAPSETARALEACRSRPSSSIRRKPFALIAARFLLRAMNVTSSPASESRAPSRPPIAPAPTTVIFTLSLRPRSPESQLRRQADALQLACGAFRDLVHEEDLLRHLVVGGARGDESLQLAVGRRAAGLEDDDRGDLLAELGVRHA